jgi:hypothetical protein
MHRMHEQLWCMGNLAGTATRRQRCIGDTVNAGCFTLISYTFELFALVALYAETGGVLKGIHRVTGR